MTKRPTIIAPRHPGKPVSSQHLKDFTEKMKEAAALFEKERDQLQEALGIYSEVELNDWMNTDERVGRSQMLKAKRLKRVYLLIDMAKSGGQL